MYQTTYLNEGAQARVQNRDGREGHTEETTTAREQISVQSMHVEKREQSKRRYRMRRSSVHPETESEGSTYFLPPFFLLPCFFDFTAGLSALPLPFALDFASLAAWALSAFFFPVVAALPFFPSPSCSSQPTSSHPVSTIPVKRVSKSGVVSERWPAQ